MEFGRSAALAAVTHLGQLKPGAMVVAGLTLSLLAGCGTAGLQQHFDTQAPAAADMETPATLCTVYMFRQKPPMPSLVPLGVTYIGVDGVMVATMPVGSYVKLALPPGPHTYTDIRAANVSFLPTEYHQKDLTLNVVAGSTHYVGRYINWLPGGAFDEVSADKGRSVIGESARAKVIHRPLTIAAFHQRIVGPEPEHRAPSKEPAPSGPGVMESLSNALPSGQQVGDFLAALAQISVALLGAVDVEAGAGGHPRLATPVPSATATSWNAYKAPQTRSDTIIYTGNGTARALDSGVTYRAFGDRIYSSTGVSYLVSGNRLMASDGQTCTIMGNVVTCSR